MKLRPSVYRPLFAALTVAALLVRADNPPPSASTTSSIPTTAAPTAEPADSTTEPPDSAAAAQSKFGFSDQPQIVVDVLMVSLPVEKAVPLLPKLRDPATIEAAQTAILDMIASHEGKLLDWPQVITHSGHRAQSETILEQKYPSEFQPPQQPQTLGNAPPSVTPAEKALSYFSTLGLIVPTSFETRNSGTMLTVDCAASPDLSTISILTELHAVELLGMQNFPAGKDPKGEPLTVPQRSSARIK